MLDRDLADLYCVTTKRLNEQVRRNIKRFPADFMFELTSVEHSTLRSQIATSKTGRGGRRYAPFVFAEQGIAMLSSVLKSERAIQVNVAIMRVVLRFGSHGFSRFRSRKKLPSDSRGLGLNVEPLSGLGSSAIPRYQEI